MKYALMLLTVCCGVIALLLAEPENSKSSDALASTPPMGWNSWNHFANKVSDAIISSASGRHDYERNEIRRLRLRQY